MSSFQFVTERIHKKFQRTHIYQKHMNIRNIAIRLIKAACAYQKMFIQTQVYLHLLNTY